MDGRQIQYVGEADFAAKNELLAHARAMLFPIQWDEPFGLVVIEAMACGTPVLALPGGSMPELVKDGVNGYLCADPAEMAQRAVHLDIDPARCRAVRATPISASTLMVRRYEALFLEAARGEMPDVRRAAGRRTRNRQRRAEPRSSCKRPHPPGDSSPWTTSSSTRTSSTSLRPRRCCRSGGTC